MAQVMRCSRAERGWHTAWARLAAETAPQLLPQRQTGGLGHRPQCLADHTWVSLWQATSASLACWSAMARKQASLPPQVGGGAVRRRGLWGGRSERLLEQEEASALQAQGHLPDAFRGAPWQGDQPPPGAGPCRADARRGGQQTGGLSHLRREQPIQASMPAKSGVSLLGMWMVL